MLEFFDTIDSSIFLFFNGMRAPFLDTFMMCFTGKFIWVPLYATLLFCIFRGAGFRCGVVFTLAVIVAVTLTDQTCATIIRPVAVRLRPSNLDNPLSEFAQVVDDYRGGSYGFPSCHAANSFALAVFMALFYRRRVMISVMLLWAFLNSYTRLYLGVHYPGDLIVGAMIGSCFGCVCYIAARELLLRFSDALRIGKDTVIFSCIGDRSAVSAKQFVENISKRLDAPICIIPVTSGRNVAVTSAALVWGIMIITLLYITVQSL